MDESSTRETIRRMRAVDTASTTLDPQAPLGDGVILVEGFFVKLWHHQFVCFLQRSLAIKASQPNIIKAYLIAEQVWATIDHLLDNSTGGVADIESDVKEIEARSWPSGLMADEQREICTLTVLSNIGGMVDQLEKQLSRGICSNPAFNAVIRTLVLVLMESSRLIRVDLPFYEEMQPIVDQRDQMSRVPTKLRPQPASAEATILFSQGHKLALVKPAIPRIVDKARAKKERMKVAERHLTAIAYKSVKPETYTHAYPNPNKRRSEVAPSIVDRVVEPSAEAITPSTAGNQNTT